MPITSTRCPKLHTSALSLAYNHFLSSRSNTFNATQRSVCYRCRRDYVRKPGNNSDRILRTKMQKKTLYSGYDNLLSYPVRPPKYYMYSTQWRQCCLKMQINNFVLRLISTRDLGNNYFFLFRNGYFIN